MRKKSAMESARILGKKKSSISAVLLSKEEILGSVLMTPKAVVTPRVSKKILERMKKKSN